MTWPPADDAYLRGLWRDPARSGRRIALAMAVLGRSRASVVARVAALGLRTRRRRSVRLVRAWWPAYRREGYSVTAIAREAGVCVRTVRRELGRVGVRR